MLLPVLGGVVAGTGAVIAAQKWSQHSLLAAGLIGAGGLAALSAGKKTPWLAQAGAGAVIGATVIAAVPYVVGAIGKTPMAQAPPKPQALRGADGADGFVTRDELNDALSKVADQQKQGHCDLLFALDDIRKIVANAEQQQYRQLPSATSTSSGNSLLAAVSPTSGPQSAQGPKIVSRVIPFSVAGRDGYDDTYARNAYGDDERDGDGDDERNAAADEYTRSAYDDDDERDADGDDERNADEDEYGRNAYGDDERDADGDDERDADGDERDADGDDERNADDWE